MSWLVEFHRSKSLQLDAHLRLKQAPGPLLVPENLQKRISIFLVRILISPIGDPRKGPYDVLAGPLFSNAMPPSFSSK
jgi:hypothetical protein